jgi:DMSO/TMAO reductase YedYZ molybdopterin-dependent catalytic subunit
MKDMQDGASVETEASETADREDRRRFLRGAGFATVGAIAGLTIPFERNMPAGLVPAAFAQDDPLAGKDGLVLLGDRPVNAETPAHLLDDAVTPTNRHFIRNNGQLPFEMNAETWTLEIDGFVDNPMTLTIADLRERFEVVTRVLHIECGGNGRYAFDPPARGNQWTYGAIGCSEWTGVRLKDVLEAAGVQSAAVYTAHYGADVHLTGDPELDTISRGLPIEKALDDDVLIAFEQNGGPIDPMNGAPLRIVAPGWPGSCSQKWLTRIWVRDVVHDGEKMMGSSYRMPAFPVAPGTEVANEDMVIMGAMPVKSIVTFPANGAETGLSTEVRGHAWVGDRTVERLEVSIDFGATWIDAELDAPVNRGAWQNWRTNVTFPMAGYYEIWARATDSEGVSQPHAVAWNPRGYGNNMMHRVGVAAS